MEMQSTSTHYEGWQGQRYGHYMELDASQSYLEAAGFVEVSVAEFVPDTLTRVTGIKQGQGSSA